jgi:hypothetical protein
VSLFPLRQRGPDTSQDRVVLRRPRARTAHQRWVGEAHFRPQLLQFRVMWSITGRGALCVVLVIACPLEYARIERLPVQHFFARSAPEEIAHIRIAGAEWFSRRPYRRSIRAASRSPARISASTA